MSSTLVLEFDVKGNKKQLECCELWNDKTTKDIAYGGSKGSGKTYLGCSLIFSDAFTYPGTHYFIARKKLNDLRKYTRPSIEEVFDDWGITKDYWRYDGNDNFYELHNKSKVFLIEAKYLPGDPKYMRFGSMQMTRGWIEEAGEFEEDAKNNLMASLGRWKNDIYNIPLKLLQTCNPSKNYLYRDYYKKAKAKTLEVWKAFIQALPEDNKCLPKGYIQNLRDTLNKNQKERLLYGNWEFDDDPSTLIDYNSILDYWNPDHIKREGISHLSIDVARKGRDTTIFRVWVGWLVVERICLEISLVNEVVDEAKKLMAKHSIPKSRVVADEDGVGGGVVDYLDCYGFVNNSRALKGGNYDNLKSQCSFKMAEKICLKQVGEICRDGKVIDTTSEEMEQVKEKNIDSDGKKAIIPKKLMIEKLGRSPDDWDSIMMRYVFELAPKPQQIKRSRLL